MIKARSSSFFLILFDDKFDYVLHNCPQFNQSPNWPWAPFHCHCYHHLCILLIFRISSTTMEGRRGVGDFRLKNKKIVPSMHPAKPSAVSVAGIRTPAIGTIFSRRENQGFRRALRKDLDRPRRRPRYSHRLRPVQAARRRSTASETVAGPTGWHGRIGRSMVVKQWREEGQRGEVH